MSGFAVTTCRHHYILEPGDKPFSRGTCRFCGHVKSFDNGWDEEEKKAKSPFQAANKKGGQALAQKKRKEASTKVAPVRLACAICQQPIPPGNPSNAKTCSPVCSKKLTYQRGRERDRKHRASIGRG